MVSIVWFFFSKEEQKKVADCNIADKCGDLAAAPKVKLSTQRLLKGHINKVNSVHFSDDSRWLTSNINWIITIIKMNFFRRHCVSGSLDGKLIIWDTWTGNKVQVNFSRINVKVHFFLLLFELRGAKHEKIICESYNPIWWLGNSIAVSLGDECRICIVWKFCRWVSYEWR